LPNVELVPYCEITALEGRHGELEAVIWYDGRNGETVRRAIRHLFLFIGADPNADWLSGSGVALDAKGFIRTGKAGRRHLGTSLEGAFAIGDVRCGSVKRAAAAVSEGAQVVATLHSYLADLRVAEPLAAVREPLSAH
jgi:thioredoxin reductase (NADPH)